MKKSSIFYSILFSSIILGGYKILGYLGVTIAPTIKRATYPILMHNTFTTNEEIDRIILLSLITSTIVLFVLNKKNKFFKFSFRKFVFTSLWIVLIFETISILRWLIYPIIETDYLSSIDWQITIIETDIYYFLALASSVLTVFLLFSWLIKRIVITTITMIKDTEQIKNSLINSLYFTHKFSDYKIGEISKRERNFILLAIIIIAIIIPLTPYIPSINPDNYTVSVDVRLYNVWLEPLEEDITNLHLGTNLGDRPLSLLTIYSIEKTFGIEQHKLLQYFPVLLTPIFCISVYLAVREGTKNELTAVICSAFSLVSYITLVGIYAGLFSNWLAVIVIFFSIYFLLRYFNRYKKEDFLIFSILLILSFFFHSYSAYYFGISLVFFLIFSTISNSIQKKNAFIVGIMIVTALLINYTYTEIIVEVPSSFEFVQSFLGNSAITIENFAERWETIFFIMTVREGGIFSNSIMIGLAIFWIITMNFRNKFEVLLFSHMPIITLLFLFGNATIQSRQFYVLPVILFATLGAIKITKYFEFKTQEKWIFFSALIAFNTNYLLRTLMNLYLVLPEKT